MSNEDLKYSFQAIVRAIEPPKHISPHAPHSDTTPSETRPMNVLEENT